MKRTPDALPRPRVALAHYVESRHGDVVKYMKPYFWV